MFSRMIDFGDIAIRLDEIRRLERGVDGTTIHCGYVARDESPTTTMPYRDALKLYEDTRAIVDAETKDHMLQLARASVLSGAQRP